MRVSHLKQGNKNGLWVNPSWENGTPGLFFFIVGLSNYPSLESIPGLRVDGVKGPASGAYHLFEWLSEKYQHENFQLAQGFFLPAPLPGEDCGYGPPAKTDFQFIKSAFQEFRRLVIASQKSPTGGPLDCSHSRVVIYLSGHGIGQGQDVFFLPTNPETESELISYRSVHDAFTSLNLSALVTFVDCCRATFPPQFPQKIQPDSIFAATAQRTSGRPSAYPTIFSAPIGETAGTNRKKGYTLFSEALRECLKNASTGGSTSSATPVTWVQFTEDLKKSFDEQKRLTKRSQELDIHQGPGDGRWEFYVPEFQLPTSTNHQTPSQLLISQTELLQQTIRAAFPTVSKFDGAFQRLQQLQNRSLSPVSLDKILPSSSASVTGRHATTGPLIIAAIGYLYRNNLSPEDMLNGLMEIYSEDPAAQSHVITFWKDLAMDFKRLPDRHIPAHDRCYVPTRPFVGRHSFREALNALLAPTGYQKAIVVEGKPGAGSSYLKELTTFLLGELALETRNQIILLPHDPENNRPLDGFAAVLKPVFSRLNTAVLRRIQNLNSDPVLQLLNCLPYLEKKQLWFVFDGLPTEDRGLFLDFLVQSMAPGNEAWAAATRIIFIGSPECPAPEVKAPVVHTELVAPLNQLDILRFIKDLRIQEGDSWPLASEVSAAMIDLKATKIFLDANEQASGDNRARQIAINSTLLVHRKKFLTDGSDPFWE